MKSLTCTYGWQIRRQLWWLSAVWNWRWRWDHRCYTDSRHGTQMAGYICFAPVAKRGKYANEFIMNKDARNFTHSNKCIAQQKVTRRFPVKMSEFGRRNSQQQLRHQQPQKVVAFCSAFSWRLCAFVVNCRIFSYWKFSHPIFVAHAMHVWICVSLLMRNEGIIWNEPSVTNL